ncbi:SAM-dependent methyltransferase [Paramagnetospirillum kuznetsovii]|uniref:SAM-dependent methyltransferase n=1 Tax=Paramagnetospirillum kuznetsovii TaxID=2053833 RepID=A0A364NWT3_9PROT|nr:methyltransferase [Paramagnetospirillum kuznetsovii]RAU21367.1 SAM-dependent methyltransferase [Paramagnetospirillum kuznetsovii]
MDRKQRIRNAFSSAAAGYDAAAAAQERAADLVAERIKPAVRVLELGCGTGLLTRRLLARLGPEARLLATDLSPAMIERTRQGISDPRLSLAVMDAEQPTGGGYDLIVSSLAAQWFGDLRATLGGLAGLLAPGGTLLVATLGARTFLEWRAAHADLGLTSGVADYPDAAELAAMLPGAEVEAAPFAMTYPDARAFLKVLAAIGAATPRPGHTPLPASRLRAIMAALGSPCAVTWDILILSFSRNSQ